MYDIGIVGAGPAGATLARLLSDRYKVLLLNSGRPKCCGGILSAQAQTALAGLDLAVPKHVLADPQPAVVSIMDWNNHLLRSYPRQYINIDRNAFDRWLLSLVPSSVDIRHHAVYRYSERHAEGQVLHFKENDAQKSARVRWLIGADGAFSAVRREFFSTKPMPKRYTAVQHWFEQKAVSADTNFGIDVWNDYTGIFDSSLTDFYLWMIPKSGQLILGGAFPFGTHYASAMCKVKEKLAALGLSFGCPIMREAGQILRPVHRNSLCLGDARVILLGEAAGLISPSSAEGISGAVDGAVCLAESFCNSDFDPQSYRRLLRYRLWNLWLKRFRIPFMYNVRLRKYVMFSGLTALRTGRSS